MRKRKIFYIPGFDPRSEAYYKKLLLTQFPEIKALCTAKNSHGVVFNNAQLQVDYEILSWHHNVQNHWLTGLQGNAINVIALFKEFVFKGGYWRGSKVTLKDAFQKGFSVYLFTLWFILAGVVLWGLGQGFTHLLPTASGYSIFAWALALSLWGWLNWGVYRLFERLHLFWVTRIMRFFARYAQQKTPDVYATEHAFNQKIIHALRSADFDEVVVVGHSVGTILTLNILSGLQNSLNEQQAKQLKVITLGHCVTGVSVVKEAGWFNQRLARLVHKPGLWIDVTAGKDAVNFYKVNPAFDTPAHPDITLSAQFHQIFSPSFYKTLKWRFYDVHFLYLYQPHFPERSVFNYAKLLFDARFFQQLPKAVA